MKTFTNGEVNFARFDPVRILLNMTVLSVLLTIGLPIIATGQSLQARADQPVINTYISIDADNESVARLLERISSKSGYVFIYSDETINKLEKRSLHISNGNIEYVLDELLASSKIDYQFHGNQIVLSTGKNKIKKLNRNSIGNNLPSDISQPELTPTVRQTVRAEEFKTITGTVTDSGDGSPLPGVNILVKDTNLGTVTDINGAYSIDAPDDATVLVFSSVGYNSEEIVIGDQSVINVSMIPDIQSLSEVVVTALGIKKETKSLGYATSSATGEEISANRTSNFMNALQGKMAGVNIQGLSSGPAGTSKIRIRGQSSIGAENTPLIVINGVPVNNTNFVTDRGTFGANNPTGATSDGGDGLSSINPDDIESMTVLKGAAASALYGSRAKDGVIMITTKSRSTNGLQLEYNTNFQTQTPLDFTDFQYEYGQGEFGVRPTTANPVSGVWSFGERFQPGMTQVLFDGITVPYEPVRDRIKKFYRTGTSWTNTISIASGGENGGVRLSLANLDNKGIVSNNEFTRQTINLGFSQNLSEKLQITGSMNYSYQKTTNAPGIIEQDLSTPTVIYSMSNSMPLDLLESEAEDEFGNERIWSRFRNRTNPYFTINNAFNNIERDRIFGNIAARYNFTDGLYAQIRVGQDYYTRQQEHNVRPTGAAALASAPAGFFNGNYRIDNRIFREINADFLIGGNKTFGDFGVDVTLGGNHMYRFSDLYLSTVQDFVVRDLYTVQNGRNVSSSYNISEFMVNSLYGAAEVNYKGFVYLNATLRNDWFSTLAPGNRAALYPSLTGSFVFSQAFETLPDWIDFGKVRIAYAEVGSDGDVAPYQNSLYYGTNANLFQGSPIGNITSSTVPNANLTNMKVSEWEFGLEAKLFDNRVGLNLSYYNRLSFDQILNVQISNTSGYTNQLINIGESRNQGLEILASVMPVRNDNFSWNFIFTGSYNTSEVLNLGEADEITVSQGEARGAQLRHVVGKPIGQLYGFAYLRDDQGNQVFDEGNGRPLSTPDRVNFGNAVPTWVGGFNNEIRYKDINLSFLIDFKLGHKLISTTNFNAWRHGLHKGTLVGREENQVVGVGVNPDGGQNTTPSDLQEFYQVVRSSNLMEEFVYNAGFWKLRQVTLGYDFTKFLGENSFIRGIKVDFVARNVLMLKKWVDNIDPEQIGFASDNLNGIEDPALPTTRNLGFNLNIKF